MFNFKKIKLDNYLLKFKMEMDYLLSVGDPEFGRNSNKILSKC